MVDGVLRTVCEKGSNFCFLGAIFYVFLNVKNKLKFCLNFMSVGPRCRFQCDDCAYSCTRTDKLALHRLTVHDGVKYTCHLCTFTATRKERLTNHRQVFICSSCVVLAVFRIHDILMWIRIRGSMPLIYGSGSGSGSCYFRHWPSRRQQKTNLKKKFFCLLLFEGILHFIFQR